MPSATSIVTLALLGVGAYYMYQQQVKQEQAAPIPTSTVQLDLPSQWALAPMPGEYPVQSSSIFDKFSHRSRVVN